MRERFSIRISQGGVQCRQRLLAAWRSSTASSTASIPTARCRSTKMIVDPDLKLQLKYNLWQTAMRANTKPNDLQ
jgi:hypothetical protein